ncbi:MAG: hypothetical protein AAF846_29170 [Chloroflexota bacterium]
MVQPFYVDTTGAWVLGHNQQQHAGTHLHAGARADLIPAPITKALSTFGGRIAAQTMQYMFRGDNKLLLNYVALRPYAMMEAIKIALGTEPEGKVVLNPASGFSPIYYWLAREIPQATFIELDTPKMISDKQTALKEFDLPDNLKLIPSDLNEVNLHTAYDKPIDVIVVSGAYVTHKDYRDMLKYITSILADDGYVIATFPFAPGVENFVENSAVFARIVSNPVGVLNSETELKAIFKDTDFTPTRTLILSELANKYNKPKPMDAEVIVIAQKGDKPILDDDDLKTIADLNDTLHDAVDKVPPFIEFDPETFARFPRRRRLNPPKK